MDKELQIKNRELFLANLEAKGYRVSFGEDIYPDIKTLPDDYPWRWGGSGPWNERKGYVPGSISSDYPIKCATLVNPTILRLNNTELIPLRQYHAQLEEMASTRCGMDLGKVLTEYLTTPHPQQQDAQVKVG